MQSLFGQALLNPDIAPPDGVIRPDGSPATKRFDVYRNNVVVSLISALGDGYPVVKKAVGDAFFDAMAGVYVRANPPKSPLMMYYGDNFADFLTSFEPTQQLPYLPDVARLEWARRTAYHAADEPGADLTVLNGLDETALLECRFTFQSAAQLIASRYPVLSIWQFNQAEGGALPQSGEVVLVSRPSDTVLMTKFGAGGRTFLTNLMNGTALGEAVNASLAATSDFDLSQNLSHLFASGALGAIIKN